MYSFLGCLAMLIIGFLVYGKLVDTIFKPTDEPTPAVRINDGVDYIPLPTWKVFMIQLLKKADFLLLPLYPDNISDSHSEHFL